MGMKRIFNLEKYRRIYVLGVDYIVVMMIILMAVVIDDLILALMERATY